MKHISMHTIEYLRAHLAYEKIRITILSLLTSPIIVLIILIAILLGGLYSTFVQLDLIRLEATEHEYMNLFPYEIPNVVINPMIGLPLHEII